MIAEGYYWIRRSAGDLIIGEAVTSSWKPVNTIMWYFCGSEEEWDDPGGEIVCKIEEPRAPTRAEQVALTPRDARAIREADPYYPPAPKPAEDKEAFAADAEMRRRKYEAHRKSVVQPLLKE